MTSQASSHQVPVGVSTPVKPSCSADLATWARYSMSGGRVADQALPWSPGPCAPPAEPVTGVWSLRGTLCPRPTMARPSPEVGRNQWNTRLMRNSRQCC